MELLKSTLKFLFALVHVFSSIKLSIGSDTLFPNQTIADGQTLISSNHMFEMGFFSPASSNNRFLGIWYKCTPDVVVWVANRNHPITHSKALHLAMAGNGDLTISSGGCIVWSQNSSRFMSNPVLRLLDTGNLVLVDEACEVSSQCYGWQSFDYPTDTLLPGMKMVDSNDAGADKYLTSWKNSDDPSHGDFVFKIDNNGLADMVIYKGIKKLYRTGTWNGLYYSATPPFPTPVFNPEMVFNEEKLVSFSEPYDDSFFTRVKVDTSGSVQHLVLNAMKDKWNPAKVVPGEPCEEYNSCGPFSVCTAGTYNKCLCLKGFVPKSQKDWDLHEWSGGCTRRIPLNCEDQHFVEVTRISYPDMLQFSLNLSMSIGECKAECIKNCCCIAYANPYISNGGSGCLMWFGELIDTKVMSSTDKQQRMYIRLSNSEIDYSIGKNEDKKNTLAIFIFISVVSGVLLSSAINGSIRYVARQMKQAENTEEDVDTTLYKLSVIVSATQNFSEENLLGQGGYGPVYKGNLSPQLSVAIKRLSGNSRQGLAEFKNEVTLIAKLQHRNLVKLLGCCIEKGERILIYEYLQNKSLDAFLFDQNRRTLLTWPKRFDIIMGIARGLLYLHHDSRLKVIHRDLKTSNILLDGNLNPKISDFGLARNFEEDQLTARTKRVAGTFGYMSPEYVLAGKFSTKSDIFSLGVMLLEIVSGKRNRPLVNCYEWFSLLEQAWLLWKEEDSLKLMDECLVNTIIDSQVKRCIHIGLLCVQRYAEDRPDMISVYSMLASDEGALPDPKEPGFFFERSSNVVKPDASTSKNTEDGTITITDLEAR